VDVPALLPGRRGPGHQVGVVDVRQVDAGGDGQLVPRDGPRVELDQAVGAVARVVLELNARDAGVAQRLQESPRQLGDGRDVDGALVGAVAEQRRFLAQLLLRDPGDLVAVPAPEAQVAVEGGVAAGDDLLDQARDPGGCEPVELGAQRGGVADDLVLPAVEVVGDVVADERLEEPGIRGVTRELDRCLAALGKERARDRNSWARRAGPDR
jgi:hypothetical protein